MAAAATPPPARRRPEGKRRRRAWQAALFATSLCACLAARRWGGGSGSGNGERWRPPPPGETREQNAAAREVGGVPGLAAGREGRRAGGARRGEGGATATTATRLLRVATSSPLGTSSGDFLRMASASGTRGGGRTMTTASSTGAGSSTTPESAAAGTTADAAVGYPSEKGPAGAMEEAAAPAPALPPSPSALERELASSSSGGLVRTVPGDGPRKKVDVDAMAFRAGGGDPPAAPASSVSATATPAAARQRRGAAASRRASSTRGDPIVGKGDAQEVLTVEGGVGVRRSLRRGRRLQSSSVSQPPGRGRSGQEGASEEDEQEAPVYEQGEDEDDGAFGSAGLLAFLVCFGLLFCVMEVAKCYFLVECRRRQRWRRQRARGHMDEGHMPIASSRVVAPEVPVAGAKDGWVEVVVHAVSLSAAKPEDGDAKIPSAHGYAVAGASHALQEAIEHARRLSPGRGYRAVFASPARPGQQQQHQHQHRRRQQEEAGVSREMSGMPGASEVQSRPATPATATAAATAGGGGGGVAPLTAAR